MAGKKHIHRYQRGKLNDSYVIYRCNLPDCSHYLPRDMVRGKQAICNRCGNIMIMGPLQLSLAKPHCNDCVETKGESKRLKKLMQAIS